MKRRGRPVTRTGPWENSLKFAMIKRNLSTVALSRMSGVPHPTISRICNGQHIPTLDNARKLARALRMSIEQVFYNLGRPGDVGRGQDVRIVRSGLGKGDLPADMQAMLQEAGDIEDGFDCEGPDGETVDQATGAGEEAPETQG